MFCLWLLRLQAIGFALVPWMPSVVTLTALFFVICFTYNFTNRCALGLGTEALPP